MKALCQIAKQRTAITVAIAAIIVFAIACAFIFLQNGDDKATLRDTAAQKQNGADMANIQSNRNSLGLTSPISTSSTFSTQSSLPITFEALRAALDTAMSATNAVYAAHKPILAANGSTQSISFIYWTKGENQNPPTLVEIQARASIALNEQKAALLTLKEAIASNNQDAMHSAAQAQISASRSLAGEDVYFSIALSMSPDNPPLLMYHKGLPAWLAFQEQAKISASAAVGAELTLSSIIQASPLSPPVLLFTNASGQVAYVDVRSMAVHTTQPQVATTDTKRTGSDAAERESRIAAQWREFLADGFNISQFSFDGLTDLSKERGR